MIISYERFIIVLNVKYYKCNKEVEEKKNVRSVIVVVVLIDIIELVN